MTHKISWFAYSGPGVRIPKRASMRGRWGYDATCSCGWDSKTGGAVQSYVTEQVREHKETHADEGVAQTAKDKIYEAAQVNGWQLFEESFYGTLWRRGSTHVMVYFSVAGTVITASSGTTKNGRNITGSGKATRVLEVLNS